MRCNTCDYPLWDTTARICPECGTGFRVADFAFRPGAVRFCCPHCRQDYYGTSPTGHLEPEVFDCVTCGRRIEMEAMPVVPIDGAVAPLADAGRIPWIEDSDGRVRRWWRTVKQTFQEPSAQADGIPEQGSIVPSLGFAAINLAVVMVASIVMSFGMFGLLAAIGAGLGGGGGGGMGVVAGAMSGMVLGQAAIGMAMALVSIFVWSAISHAVLKVTGETRGGIAVTFQCVAYSSSAYLVSLIPCIGGLGGLYWAIVAGILIAKGQRVSGLRATLSILAVAGVGIGITIAVFAAGMGGMWMGGVGRAAAAGGAAATPAFQEDPASRAARIRSGLQSVYEVNGAFPDHPARLISLGTVPVGDFGGDPDFDRLSGLTLTQFQTALPAEAERAIQDEIAAGRKDIGDVLFCYPVGASFDVFTDPRGASVWLFMVAPDLGRLTGNASILVQTPTGTNWYSLAEFTGALKEQNELRAQLGIEPAPTPFAVRKP